MESFGNDEMGGGNPAAIVAIADLDAAVFEEVSSGAGGFFSHFVEEAAMPLMTTLTT